MDLDEMTREQLLKEAKKLELKGLSQKDKGTIQEAVKQALEAAEAERKMREEEGLPPVEPPQLEGEPLTGKQVEALRANSDGNIRAALAKSGISRQWSQAFEAELRVREQRAREAAALEARKSPVGGYYVTKGGRFVANGRITKIHTGVVVYETTHDLAELDRQCIEYEPFEGTIELVKNALGLITTRIVQKP